MSWFMIFIHVAAAIVFLAVLARSSIHRYRLRESEKDAEVYRSNWLKMIAQSNETSRELQEMRKSLDYWKGQSDSWKKAFEEQGRRYAVAVDQLTEYYEKDGQQRQNVLSLRKQIEEKDDRLAELENLLAGSARTMVYLQSAMAEASNTLADANDQVFGPDEEEGGSCCDGCCCPSRN